MDNIYQLRKKIKYEQKTVRMGPFKGPPDPPPNSTNMLLLKDKVNHDT